MMMSRLKIWLGSAVLILTPQALVFAQVTLEATTGDTVVLATGSFAGEIQWQQSADGEQWSDLENATVTPFKQVVNVPEYYRARFQAPGCEPWYSVTLAVVAGLPTFLWSDPATWGTGGKPVAGSTVTIPSGKKIILDEDSPALAGLTINGTLEFAHKDLALTSDWIAVHGKLQAGSELQPFTHNAIITLTGSDTGQDIMGMGTRGIMVMGGTLALHGTPPAVAWTKIDQHAEAGSKELATVAETGWRAGDEIVVGPTDFYQAGNGASVSQKMSLSKVDGKQLTSTETLNAFRWGLLQYATTSGMSLSPENLAAPPVADTETATTPRVLDERAPVGNLTRNIVIQAPNDALWTEQGFGVHIMIMGQGAAAHVNGVEIRRGGQRGRLRRYAFHWHMLSYSGSSTLGDATGQYIKNSVINSSANRGIVVHGTNGLLIQNNILYDIKGHGIFTEDAVERRNTFDGNLVLHVRNSSQPLKQHEAGERGASGFWISNPDNVTVNNTAADCGAIGFWLAFPANPWGESQSVLGDDGVILNPSRLQFGVFDNNTAHSNRLEGIRIDDVEIDNDGNTFPRQYWSTTTGRDVPWPFTDLRRFTLSRYNVWKNGSNGIWDRAVWPDNFEVVSADNCGRFFAGSGSDGVIERSLVVGTSLNHLMNGTGRPEQADFAGGFSSSAPAAFATYHSTFDIKHNIVVNFEARENERSGVFSTDDYYIRPVEKGQTRNEGNLIINSHPGVKLKAIYSYFTLASALWDPHGIWGPPGNYFVYNDPFLTHGKPITEVAPGAVSGGVSVPGPFYGFEGFVLHGVGDAPPKNQPYFDLMGIKVRRLNQNLEEIATWTVPEAQPDYLLQHMRDFATSPDGIYELTFPDEDALPTNFQMNVENMLTTDDVQVMAIQFDGALTPVVGMRAYSTWYGYSKVGSLQEVRDSGGETWWQDKANNLVWVKMQGGRWQFWTTNADEAVPSSDDLLYETTVLQIFVPD